MSQNPTYALLVEYSPSLFTDVSSAMLAASVTRGMMDPLTPSNPGRAIFKMWNEDQKFNDSYTQNLVPYSEDFSHWTKAHSGTISAGTILAPDGTMNATIISDPNSSYWGSVIYFGSSGQLPGSGQYTASAFFGKDTTPASSRFVSMSLYTSTASNAMLNRGAISFDTQTGSYGVQDIAGTATKIGGILDCGSFWRAWVSIYEPSSSASIPDVQIDPAEGVGDPSSSSNVVVTAVGSCAVWGAQLNTGALKNYYPTSLTNVVSAAYIPVGKRVRLQAQNKNRLKQSENLLTSWSAIQVGVQSAALLGPDGQPSFTITTSATTGNRYLAQQSPDPIAYRDYTASVMFYPGSTGRCGIQVYTGGTDGLSANFDVSSGTIVTSKAQYGSAVTFKGVSLLRDKNGWWRAALSVNVASCSTITFAILNRGSTIGDNLFATAAQFELGAEASDYVSTTASANPTYDLFYGYLQSTDLDPALGNRVATLNCYDSVERLGRTNVSLPLAVNFPVNSLVSQVATYAGVGSYAAIDRIVDTVPYFSPSNTDALSALGELVRMGHYYFFVGGDGTVNFKDRNAYVTAAAAGSYHRFGDQFSVAYNDDRMINDAVITGAPRVQATDVATVAWLTQQVTVPGSGSTDFWLKYVDPANTALPTPANSMVTPTRSADYLLSSTASGGSDLTSTCSASVTFFGESAKCTMFNGDGTTGYVSKFQLQGYSLQQQPAISQTNVNSAAMAQYGDKRFSLDTNALPSADYAAGYAEFLVGQYSPMFPAITAQLGKNLFPDILSHDVGTVLAAQNSFTGVNSIYLVREVQHEIQTDRGHEHTLTVTLDVLRVGSYLVLDDATYGVLDTRALGF